MSLWGVTMRYHCEVSLWGVTMWCHYGKVSLWIVLWDVLRGVLWEIYTRILSEMLYNGRLSRNPTPTVSRLSPICIIASVLCRSWGLVNDTTKRSSSRTQGKPYGVNGPEKRCRPQKRTPRGPMNSSGTSSLRRKSGVWKVKREEVEWKNINKKEKWNNG